MSQFQLVLDDNLLAFFYKIKSGAVSPDELNTQQLSDFFKFYRPHLTNLQQIERLEKNKVLAPEIISRIKPVLAKQMTQSRLELGDLLKHTDLKLVLTEDKVLTDSHYVDIHNTMFDAHYIISVKKNACRNNLLKYLESLLLECKSELVIRDKHIHTKPFFSDFFKLFPSKKINIYHSHFDQTTCTKMKKHCSAWVIKPDTMHYSDLHDRYIRIDNKIEIIVSSGVDYLFDKSKEVTCVFRCL